MGLAPNKKRSSLRRDHWRWLKVRQMPTGELRANGEIGAGVVSFISTRAIALAGATITGLLSVRVKVPIGTLHFGSVRSS